MVCALGLYEVLRQSYLRSGLQEPDDLKAVARGYSCDGCYEPMFTGRSEFKFAYVSLLQVFMYTIKLVYMHTYCSIRISFIPQP